MLVKICGIQTLSAANAAANAEADFIGFVFAESSRQVTPQVAKEIAEQLPGKIKKVGVFVNESPEKMKDIANFVGLDFLQLHGEESATVAEQLPYRIIKAFGANSINREEIHSYPCDYYLIDSPRGKYRGGTGKPFNWHRLLDYRVDSRKLILAGGLTVDNVSEAISIVKPIGVDVSSGVETDGKKDSGKMTQFINRAKTSGKDERIDNLYNAR